MNKAFLTDCEHPTFKPSSKKPGFFSYKETVEFILQEFGISLEVARVAVIDMKQAIMESFNMKRPPKQAAVLIVDDVRRIYNRS